MEGGGAGEVVGELPPATRHVFWIDACLQILAGGRDRPAAAGEQRGEVAKERDPVARQVPFVEDVAGGANRRLQTRQRLLAVGFPCASEFGRTVHAAPLLTEIEPREARGGLATSPASPCPGVTA